MTVPYSTFLQRRTRWSIPVSRPTWPIGIEPAILHRQPPPGPHPNLRGGVEATTLTDVLKGELTLPDSDWEGYCLVQRFEAGALFKSGDLVSITLRASSTGASIDRIYISQAVDPGPGIDPYDSVEYRAAMQDTVFKPPLVIPPAPPNQPNTVTIAAILYTLDN